MHERGAAIAPFSAYCADTHPTHPPHNQKGYELLRGNLVRFSSDAHAKPVPTAVLVHGILGSRRNLQGFARMLVEVGAVLVVVCWVCAQARDGGGGDRSIDDGRRH